MLNQKEKEEIIKNFNIHKSDTGSPEVQIALLTKEIQKLTKHFKNHPKDLHSRRGLVMMVAKRRKLLNYLKKEDQKRYNNLTKKLGLKKR